MNFDDEIKKLADEHWEYVGQLMEFVYKTALIHGGKHMKELMLKHMAFHDVEKFYPENNEDEK